MRKIFVFVCALCLPLQVLHAVQLTATEKKDLQTLKGLRRLCDTQNVPHLKAGLDLEIGYYREKDLMLTVKALKHYTLGCNANEVMACIRLGALYSALGTDQRNRLYLERARTAYSRGCSLRDATSCKGLNQVNNMMYSVPAPSNSQGIEAGRKLIAVSNAMGWVHTKRGFEALVDSLQTGDLSRYADYLEACQSGCQSKEFLSCTQMASAYPYDKFPHRHAQYLSRACESGHKESCDQLASLPSSASRSSNVSSTPSYVASSEDSLVRACKANLQACARNAIHELQAGNKNKAIKLFTTACDGNQASACTSLSYIYMLDKYKVKDIDLAMRYARKACDLDNGAGCYNLAIFSKDSRSPIDEGEQKRLLNRACQLNHKPACRSKVM